MTVAPLGGSPQVSTWAEPQMRRCYSVGWGLVDPQMTPHTQRLWGLKGARQTWGSEGKSSSRGWAAQPAEMGEGNWVHRSLDQADQQLESEVFFGAGGAGGSADLRGWTDSCSFPLACLPGGLSLSGQMAVSWFL